MRPETKRWTAEEDDVLRQEALVGSPVSEIASKIGRSESAVRTRAYTLRVPLRIVGMRRSASAW
jgi:DNA-directed RNA polymerase specialized sigma24 family protein